MQALTRVVSLADLHPRVVDVRVDLGVGEPDLRVHGLSPTVSRETRDRVRAAIRNTGLSWGEQTVHVTCSTAHPRSDVDLAVATAVLLATGTVPTRRLVATALIGELGLDGRVRPVRGVLPRAIAAAQAGFTHVVVPAANAAEAVHVPGITVVPVSRLSELVAWLTGGPAPTVPRPLSDAGAAEDDLWATDRWTCLDPAAVRGAALAAAGGHHTLLLAPPGTGASLLPRLVTTLIPDLTDDHAIEVTGWHSLAGAPLPDSGLITRPPCVRLHHTVTPSAVAGTATQPGMITLAHHGTLALADLTEFAGTTIDVLRPVLVRSDVTIAGTRGPVSRPAVVRAVFTVRECPGDCPQAADCTCSPARRTRHLSRIPLWLLARVDVFLHRLTLPDPVHSPTPLEDVRDTVAQALDRAARRWGTAPSVGQLISDAQAREGVPADVTQVLDSATEDGRISRATASRYLRLAWTMADLDGRAHPTQGDVQLILAQRARAYHLLRRSAI